MPDLAPAVLAKPPAPAGGTNHRVLIIDDEAAIRESLETLLELEGYTVEMASDGHRGLAMLDQTSYDLVLLDLALPGMNGIELIPRIHERQPQVPVIMITAYGTVNNVVDAIRAGAQNFVQKPWDNEKLLADIRASIARFRAEVENLHLKRALKQRYNFSNIVGKSDAMLRIFDLVAQVAPSRSTVLIQGESGTGKELIAKALHANSPRKDKPFIPVNTGAVPSELLESTLFGHVKGAFTSAIASKKGLFEVANGGTLFLDEIGTMGLDTQSKLLRVLQDRKFMHLGGIQEVQVDVRTIHTRTSASRQFLTLNRKQRAGPGGRAHHSHPHLRFAALAALPARAARALGQGADRHPNRRGALGDRREEQGRHRGCDARPLYKASWRSPGKARTLLCSCPAHRRSTCQLHRILPWHAMQSSSLCLL